MTDGPIVRFVSAPSVSAEVRFDFNTAGDWSDTSIWPRHEGFSLGGSTLIGDPDSYSNTYGLRQLTFNLVVEGTYTDAARAWSQLSRELTGRRHNWLLFQFSEHAPPVWFKTYRSDVAALDFELVRSNDDSDVQLWGFPIQLFAEKCAYGERVTLPPFTINNDPADSTNPCMAVLPTIIGDAPAPARFDVVPSATQFIPAPMFAVTPVADDFAAPIVTQIGTGDTVTLGTDLDVPVASTAYSGGSYRPVTFATTEALVNRVSFSTNVRPGKYAIMVRIGRASGSGTQYTLQAVINQRVSGRVVTMDRPASAIGGAYKQYVNLGVFTLPSGLADPDATGTASANIGISAARVAGGSAQLLLDCVVLVPMEVFPGEPGQQLTTLPELLAGDPGYVNRWDGDGGFYQSYVGGNPAPQTPAILQGQFPTLMPGRRNVMHLFRHAHQAARIDPLLGDVRSTTDNGNSDSNGMSTTVTISYHPRFVHLASA